ASGTGVPPTGVVLGDRYDLLARKSSLIPFFHANKVSSERFRPGLCLGLRSGRNVQRRRAWHPCNSRSSDQSISYVAASKSVSRSCSVSREKEVSKFDFSSSFLDFLQSLELPFSVEL